MLSKIKSRWFQDKKPVIGKLISTASKVVVLPCKKQDITEPCGSCGEIAPDGQSYNDRAQCDGYDKVVCQNCCLRISYDGNRFCSKDS